MTEERPAEDNLGRLFYSIKKTKTADDLLHFLQSRAKKAVIIAKRIGVCYMYRDIMNDLIKWKNRTRRKPLIISGVRQCGKSKLSICA